MGFLNERFFYVIFLICSLLTSCSSTKIENEQQIPLNFVENGIEILIPENVNSFILYRDVDADTHDWQGQYKYEDETIDNITVFVDNIECKLYLYKFTDYLMSFILGDMKGQYLDIRGKKILLQSKRVLTYSDLILGSQIKINGEKYGSKSEPINCLLYFKDLQFGDITEIEQRKRDLANSIIIQKYGFKDLKDYNNWKKRASYSNFYESLSQLYETYSYPFEVNDLIPVDEQHLVIMGMENYSDGYIYNDKTT